ncbi:Swi3-domain-containing protein, partial [Suillus cothurnatus]
YIHALDDIWDAPISPARGVTPHLDTVNSQKRPIETLFLSDSDNEDEQTGAEETYSSAPRPDAEEKHALTPHQILPSSSPPRDLGPDEDNEGGKDNNEKGKEGKKERKKVLIQNIKDFKVKGKGHERSDLQRILQVYQFWSHRLYPKTPFKDTVERVEKLCHSKRMQVRLSVWRDEAKGLVNGKEPGENGSNNVIDLTDPNFEGADEEEKRLAAFRAQRSVSPAPPAPKAKYKLLPPEAADGMDIDEEAMWNDLEIFDDPIPNPAPPPPKSSKPSLLVDDQDEEMWDMVRELEREENIQHRSNFLCHLCRARLQQGTLTRLSGQMTKTLMIYMRRFR